MAPTNCSQQVLAKSSALFKSYCNPLLQTLCKLEQTCTLWWSGHVLSALRLPSSINAVLEEFTESRNNQPLSTAGSLTPNQLFVQTAVGQHVIPQLLQQNTANHTHIYTPSWRSRLCSSSKNQVSTLICFSEMVVNNESIKIVLTKLFE